MKACRRCSECIGAEHHWITGECDPYDESTAFACKHCDATASMCDNCDRPSRGRYCSELCEHEDDLVAAAERMERQ